MNQAIHIAAVEHFAELGYLNDEQLADMKSSAAGEQALPLKSLLSRGTVPESSFAETVSRLTELPQFSRAQFPLQAVADTHSLSSFFLEHEVLPLDLSNGVLRLAMTDPSDEFVLQVLRAKLARKIAPVVALRSDILSALNDLYKADVRSSNDSVDIPSDLESESGVVRDIHRLIQRAVSLNASDIHFEPSDNSLRVRFRVHGLLRDAHQFGGQQSTQVIARVKLMAKLDVTEKRQAQNGRFKFPADGKIVDLRVSTLPLHDGESIVLRLLEFDLSQLSLLELGFNSDIADSLEQSIQTQHGLVLITGPTGSGKTTTLYSLLNQLNTAERKLISIEDPVELNIPGINQIQVDEEHGVSFAQALKTVLRQDPDVIMVGEIRDSETAQLAAQAALTGHLVLCTLHTASASSAVTRLQNLGLPDYLLSATLKAVLAQRLVRCLCPACKGSDQVNTCVSCEGVGYASRSTIAEFLPTAAFDTDVLSEADLSARLLNKVSLRQDAQRLLGNNVTDQAEVFRVLGVIDDAS